MFRLLADPAGSGYLLVCERWFVAKLLARLRMFILRADARIDDVSGELGGGRRRRHARPPGPGGGMGADRRSR